MKELSQNKFSNYKYTCPRCKLQFTIENSDLPNIEFEKRSENPTHTAASIRCKCGCYIRLSDWAYGGICPDTPEGWNEIFFGDDIEKQTNDNQSVWLILCKTGWKVNGNPVNSVYAFLFKDRAIAKRKLRSLIKNYETNSWIAEVSDKSLIVFEEKESAYLAYIKGQRNVTYVSVTLEKAEIK